MYWVFFSWVQTFWELIEVCEDKGYLTRLPCTCENICSSLLHQWESEQWTWQYQKSVALKKWVLDSLKACVRGWMGTRTLLGSARKFKRTWQKIFTWNGVKRGRELNAKYDYEIVKGNDECLKMFAFSKRAERLSWQKQGQRHFLVQNKKEIRRELLKATCCCVLPG